MSRSDQKIPQTVGFIFNHDLTQVLLIRKNRPAWQKGKLNGIGGNSDPLKDKDPGYVQINYDKSFIREAKEETGLLLDMKKLMHIGFMGKGKKREQTIEIYAYRLNKSQVPKQQTDETITWFSPLHLPLTLCVPDVLFLVPYAKHVLNCMSSLSTANLILIYNK